MIRDQLVSGLLNLSRKQNSIASGSQASPQQLNSLQQKRNNMIRKNNESLPKNVMMESLPGSGRVHDGYDSGNSDDMVIGGNVKMPTMKQTKSVVKKAMKKAHDIQEVVEDNIPDEVTGGRFHFTKSMKKFGKELGTGIKKAGIAEVSEEVAKNGMQFLKDNALSTVQEAVPVLESEAPMLLAAAGMKNPKRTRQVSEKEKNRHALIRQLMNKHGCTLAEASKAIKENNLSY